MDKAEFLRILALGGGAKGSGTRTDWVNMKADLLTREEPFTKADIAEEFGAKEKYVYSHLNEWRKEGLFAVVNGGSGNVYLAIAQIPEE